MVSSFLYYHNYYIFIVQNSKIIHRYAHSVKALLVQVAKGVVPQLDKGEFITAIMTILEFETFLAGRDLVCDI